MRHRETLCKGILPGTSDRALGGIDSIEDHGKREAKRHIGRLHLSRKALSETDKQQNFLQKQSGLLCQNHPKAA